VAECIVHLPPSPPLLLCHLGPHLCKRGEASNRGSERTLHLTPGSPTACSTVATPSAALLAAPQGCACRATGVCTLHHRRVHAAPQACACRATGVCTLHHRGVHAVPQGCACRATGGCMPRHRGVHAAPQACARCTTGGCMPRHISP